MFLIMTIKDAPTNQDAASQTTCETEPVQTHGSDFRLKSVMGQEQEEA